MPCFSAPKESACELGIMYSHQFGWKGDHLPQALLRMEPVTKLGQCFLPPLPPGICRESQGLPFSGLNQCCAPILSSDWVGSSPWDASVDLLPSHPLSPVHGFCCRGFVQPWNSSCPPAARTITPFLPTSSHSSSISLLVPQAGK